MTERNPYKIKKLGSRIRNFSQQEWRKFDCQIAMKAVTTKFQQNNILRTVLLNTGDKKLVESSHDSHWGTGLHLHDRNATNSNFWINKNGGIMSEILSRVHANLKDKS